MDKDYLGSKKTVLTDSDFWVSSPLEVSRGKTAEHANRFDGKGQKIKTEGQAGAGEDQSLQSN